MSLNHRKTSEEFPERNSFWAAEITLGGLTATRAGQTTSPRSRVLWPLEVADQTASLCIMHSLTATEADQTTNSSNGQKFDLKVAITSLTVQPWVVLRPDREVHRIFPMASFCSMGYKYSSILCKIALLAIWTAYILLRALSLHTQAFLDLLWLCEIIVLDSSVLELCGTSDSSRKRHQLVTLGGCHLLYGLEEWKPRAL
jgi:hypothetical protein